MASSRTPEGPLNFCPVCGKHCRIEPSPESLDATWFGHRRNGFGRGAMHSGFFMRAECLILHRHVCPAPNCSVCECCVRRTR